MDGWMGWLSLYDGLLRAPTVLIIMVNIAQAETGVIFAAETSRNSIQTNIIQVTDSIAWVGCAQCAPHCTAHVPLVMFASYKLSRKQNIHLIDDQTNLQVGLKQQFLSKWILCGLQ